MSESFFSIALKGFIATLMNIIANIVETTKNIPTLVEILYHIIPTPTKEI